MSDAEQKLSESSDLGSLARDSEKIRLKQAEERERALPANAATNIAAPAVSTTETSKQVDAAPHKYSKLPFGIIFAVIMLSICLMGRMVDVKRTSVIADLSNSLSSFLPQGVEIQVQQDLLDSLSDNLGFSAAKPQYFAVIDRLSKQYGDQDQRVVCIKLALANGFLQNGQEAAGRLWQDQLKYLQKPTPQAPKTLTSILFKLGSWYGEHNDYRSARELFEATLRFWPVAPAGTSLSNAEAELAEAYFQLGENAKANEYFLKAYEYGLRFNVRTANAYRLLRICATFNNMGRYDEAKKYAEQAVEANRIANGENSSEAFAASGELEKAKAGLGERQPLKPN